MVDVYVTKRSRTCNFSFYLCSKSERFELRRYEERDIDLVAYEDTKDLYLAKAMAGGTYYIIDDDGKDLTLEGTPQNLYNGESTELVSLIINKCNQEINNKKGYGTCSDEADINKWLRNKIPTLYWVE